MLTHLNLWQVSSPRQTCRRSRTCRSASKRRNASTSATSRRASTTSSSFNRCQEFRPLIWWARARVSNYCFLTFLSVSCWLLELSQGWLFLIPWKLSLLCLKLHSLDFDFVLKLKISCVAPPWRTCLRTHHWLKGIEQRWEKAQVLEESNSGPLNLQSDVLPLELPTRSKWLAQIKSFFESILQRLQNQFFSFFKKHFKNIFILE